MVFVTAGMGGGTGTGAAPVVARCAKELGILTVGVVTKPFHFEGVRRMRVAETGISDLHKVVDTLLIIPNQNLFRVANEKTTFADAFAMADQVLYSGVACITDLMVKEGLINLDFADVRAVMREMGKAMMGTGEASGEKRALSAAEAAISNPLIDDASMKGARGLLISITGGKDLTLYEVDEAATRIREEVDQDANIIVGATFDEALDGIIRVSVVATGIDQAALSKAITSPETRIGDIAQKLRSEQQRSETHRANPDRLERTETRPHQLATPTIPTAQFQQSMDAIESAAKAAVAAAVLPASDDVLIRPIPPKPSLYPEQTAQVQDGAPAKAFIPPAPERSPVRPRRMPEVDELPRPAQAELRAHRGEPGRFRKPGETEGGTASAACLRRTRASGRGGAAGKSCAEHACYAADRPTGGTRCTNGATAFPSACIATRARFGIRQTARSPGARPAWEASSCAPFARGGSAENSRLPAPSGEVNKVSPYVSAAPASFAGAVEFWQRQFR